MTKRVMTSVRVSSRYLSELPGDADGPAEAIAANEKRLHAPTPEMAEGKNVEMAEDSLPGDDVAVHSVVLQAARASIIHEERVQIVQEKPRRAESWSLTIISASRLA